MIALAGDAELDEGNIFEALLEGWKHDVRNLWWVIDYNRQSLDAVVSDRLFGRIDAMFEMFGWRVVTLEIRPAAAGRLRPAGRRAPARMDRRLPELALFGAGLQGRRGLARASAARPRTAIPASARSSTSTTTTALARLMTNLAGHDMGAVLDAFHAVTDDQPTCFIAYTIKGYGLPFAGHKDNHAGLMNPRADGRLPAAAWRCRRARSGSRSPASTCRPSELASSSPAVPFARRAGAPHDAPPIAGARAICRRRAAAALDPGGLRPHPRRPGARRRRRSPSASSRPRPTSPCRPISAPGSTAAASSTAPSAPTRSARKRSSRRSAGRCRRRASTSSSASPRAICSSCSAALGLAGPLFGTRLLPIGTLYDPFIKRGLDALNYALLPGRPLHPGRDPFGHHAGAGGRRPPIGRRRR